MDFIVVFLARFGTIAVKAPLIIPWLWALMSWRFIKDLTRFYGFTVKTRHDRTIPKRENLFIFHHFCTFSQFFASRLFNIIFFFVFWPTVIFSIRVQHEVLSLSIEKQAVNNLVHLWCTSRYVSSSPDSGGYLQFEVDPSRDQRDICFGHLRIVTPRVAFFSNSWLHYHFFGSYQDS